MVQDEFGVDLDDGACHVRGVRLPLLPPRLLSLPAPRIPQLQVGIGIRFRDGLGPDIAKIIAKKTRQNLYLSSRIFGIRFFKITRYPAIIIFPPFRVQVVPCIIDV